MDRARWLTAVPLVCLAPLTQGCDSAEPTAEEVVVHTTLRPPNQDIYLVDGTEAEPRRLTDHPALDYNATFSPDGRWLVFTSERSGSPDLYALDLEGGDEPVRLTRSPALDDAADVSPDGAWIAFATDRDGAGMKIWIQRLDGSGGRFLEPERAGTPGIDMHPRFAPGGDWVAFVSDRGGLADEFLLTDVPQPYGDIWAVPVNGGEAVCLTHDKWEDGLARWDVVEASSR